MKRRVLFAFIIASAISVSALVMAMDPVTTPEWSMNATVIEACSCPMFCQCYFNMEPAAHHEHSGGKKHFCRANLAYKVNRGNSGATKLDGAKFWIASDLGSEFQDGEMEWAVLYFDKATTKEQRDAIGKIAGYIFAVKWKSFKTAVGDIDKWEYTNDYAVATLDGGKTAEVRLKRQPGNTNDPVVITNLKYWGVPRNDGFVLMPNELEAYRVGPNKFEFKNTNGFMLTLDINSNDVAKKPASGR